MKNFVINKLGYLAVFYCIKISNICCIIILQMDLQTMKIFASRGVFEIENKDNEKE